MASIDLSYRFYAGILCLNSAAILPQIDRWRHEKLVCHYARIRSLILQRPPADKLNPGWKNSGGNAGIKKPQTELFEAIYVISAYFRKTTIEISCYRESLLLKP